MSYNRASGNGINGLVVHKTDRARVVGNVLWDNGQTPKSAPESRQQYAGKSGKMGRNILFCRGRTDEIMLLHCTSIVPKKGLHMNHLKSVNLS